MWQDPTNEEKRKPRRLRGTPANKFVTIVTLAFVGTFCSFFYWYSRSEAEWVLRNKARVLERIKPKEREAIRREMFQDPQMGAIIRQVQQRGIDKKYDMNYETCKDKLIQDKRKRKLEKRLKMDQAGKKESGVGNGSRKSLSPNKDDSLTDFKSPRLEQAAPIKITVVNDKRGKKSSSKNKSSGKKKKETVGKEVAQQSIESSFFKAANNGTKDGYTCPLCMKYFTDKNAGSSHVKSCAARNKVSTKKLLAAVALQEWQGDERVAIGLPAGPIVQPKDKTPKRPREPASKGDPDLQLALALSKSLQERQLEQEFEEALLLAGEHRGDGQIVGFSTDSERRKTLKNFGFLTNKPAGTLDGPVKTRRKKHLGPTILQTRSQETRDRILTERIAEILMGNEAITQVCQQETTAVKKQKVVLKSCLLQKIHRTTQRLWDIAQLSTSSTNYYVEDLRPIIMPPIVEKQEIPENSASNSTNIEPIVEDKNNIEDSVISDESPLADDDKLTEKMSETLEECEQITAVSKDRLKSPEYNDIHIPDRQYRNILSVDWANTLNVSSMSDVIVLVENGHIWAHKLVLYVRSSDILLDCETNTDEKFSHVKEKIRWPDVDLSTGLAFLEFVYSGLIEKNILVFSDNRVASGVRRLARKYRIKALFDYLRQKQAEFDKNCNVNNDIQDRRSGLLSPIVIEMNQESNEIETIEENFASDVDVKDAEENRELSEFTSSQNTDASSNTKTNVLVVKTPENNLPSRDNDAMSVISIVSSRSCVSMSPDLFDESTEETTVETQKNSQIDGNPPDLSDNENSNLNALADLIAQEDFSSSNEANKLTAETTIVQNRISNESYSVNDSNQLTSLSQSQMETPKSRRNFSLAGAAKFGNTSRSQPLMEKPKSNLSLLIEKVKRINAMGPLDSYTDEESLAELAGQKKRRNPFDVNNDRSDISISDSSEKIKKKQGQGRPGKRGLSVFDEPIKLTNPRKDISDETTRANDSLDANKTSQTKESSVINDTAVTDDEDISMYSKYRKTHKQNNSISNYRNILKTLANATATSVNDEKSDCSNSLNETAIDLTQESDSDVDMPPSPMSDASISNEEKSESIHSAATAVVQYNRSKDLTDDEEPKEDDLDKNRENEPQYSVNSSPTTVKSLANAKSPGISPEYSSLDVFEIDEEMFARSLKKSQVSQRKSFTPSPKSSCDYSNKTSSSGRKRRNEERRTKDTSFVDDFVSKSPADTSVEYPHFDVDDLITQSLRNTDEMPYRSPTPEENHRAGSPEKSTSSICKKRSNEEERITPQKFIDDLENDKSDESSVEAKSPRNSSDYHFEVFEPDDHVFTQSFNSSPNKKNHHRSRLKIPSPIVISSSPEFNHDTEINDRDNEQDCNKENLFTSDRISPLLSRKSLEIPAEAISPTNHEKSARFSRSSFENLGERIFPSSPERPTSPQPGTSRKYTSGNRGELNNHSKTSFVRWNSMPTSSSNVQICRKRSRTPQPESSMHIMSQDVTPPVNYNSMDTPELKKELAKYGIKPQSRNRARKLLTHIYNELHRTVPGSLLEKNSNDHRALSDLDEPPVKKIGKSSERISEDSDTDQEMPLSQESATSAASVIPEEMDFPDGNASPSNDSDDSTSTSCIKKAFNALIKEDKEIHNKVLTYEPVPLDLLHVMLKARGLKCKIKDLMDFLDEECITFQVQTSRNRKKTSRGKKTVRVGKRK